MKNLGLSLLFHRTDSKTTHSITIKVSQRFISFSRNLVLCIGSLYLNCLHSDQAHCLITVSTLFQQIGLIAYTIIVTIPMLFTLITLIAYITIFALFKVITLPTYITIHHCLLALRSDQFNGIHHCLHQLHKHAA